MSPATDSQPKTAAQLIEERIAQLGDWRGDWLARMRVIMKELVPDAAEEWKWMGTPVWSYKGVIVTCETYKSVVKLTFAKGASLKDPSGLFNSSMDGNVRRAIDIHENEPIDETALKTLILEAAAFNENKKK